MRVVASDKATLFDLEKYSLCHFCSTFPVLAGHNSEIICLCERPAGRGEARKIRHLRTRPRRVFCEQGRPHE